MIQNSVGPKRKRGQSTPLGVLRLGVLRLRLCNPGAHRLWIWGERALFYDSISTSTGLSRDAIWGIFLLCLCKLILWWQMSPDIVIVSHSAPLYNPQMPL